jgi:hypothetical protein
MHLSTVMSAPARGLPGQARPRGLCGLHPQPARARDHRRPHGLGLCAAGGAQLRTPPWLARLGRRPDAAVHGVPLERTAVRIATLVRCPWTCAARRAPPAAGRALQPVADRCAAPRARRARRARSMCRRPLRPRPCTMAASTRPTASRPRRARAHPPGRPGLLPPRAPAMCACVAELGTAAARPRGGCLRRAADAPSCLGAREGVWEAPHAARQMTERPEPRRNETLA